MKKYILFTGDITNMGGGQQYVSNKVKRLIKAGFQPIVISITEGDILLENLKKFDSLRMLELRFRPFCYTKRDRRKIVEKIIDIAGEKDEKHQYYIESNGIHFIEWAEMTAQSLKCKHVCINLQEYHNYDNCQKSFLEYKYYRNELYGISPKSIRMMLTTGIVGEKDEHYIRAECTNVVADVACPFLSDLPKADYTIGSIGRLEKVCVKEGIAEVCLFASMHQTKKINLILIGGGTVDKVTEIKESINGIKNIRLFITGYMYPIPRILLQRIDCFFSSAGSARVSMRENRPTISMHVETGKPIGILNYTVSTTLYGDEETSLSRYLEMILLEKYCDTHDTLGLEVSDFSPEAEFMRQLGFFNVNDETYYDVSTMRRFTGKERICSIIGYMFGRKALPPIYLTAARVVHSLGDSRKKESRKLQ